MKKVVVLGGTGLLGGPVARRLRADGFEVRLMARNPEKAHAMFGDSFEIVPGDVTDLGSLERALAGTDGVHVSIGGAVEQLSGENVASLAPGLGLERITYVSGSLAFEQNRWFPMIEQKLMAEKAIRECGVSYTIFCPTWPMEQLQRFVRDGRAAIIGKQPTPVHWFAADDLSRMVATAHQREEAANKRLFVHGPEALTIKEALERYCRAFHPEIESVSVMPIWLAKVIATVTRNEQLKFAATLFAFFDKAGEMGDPTEANQLLGAPTTTLDAWIEERKGSEQKGT